MTNLKDLSVLELVMKLNEIIKIKGTREVTGLELIQLDTTWNDIVFELHERLPHLKNDPDLQPVLTTITEVTTSKKLAKRPPIFHNSHI